MPNDFLDENGLVADPNNPFFGLPVAPPITDRQQIDPALLIYQEVLERFGFINNERPIINAEDADMSRVRSVRFTSILDALEYAKDGRISYFSRVVIFREIDSFGREIITYGIEVGTSP